MIIHCLPTSEIPIFKQEWRHIDSVFSVSYTFRVSFNYSKSTMEISWSSPVICSTIRLKPISGSCFPHQKHHFGICTWLISGQWKVRSFLLGFCNMSYLGTKIYRKRQFLSFRCAIWNFYSWFWWTVVKANHTRSWPGTLRA